MADFDIFDPSIKAKKSRTSGSVSGAGDSAEKGVSYSSKGSATGVANRTDIAANASRTKGGSLYRLDNIIVPVIIVLIVGAITGYWLYCGIIIAVLIAPRVIMIIGEKYFSGDKSIKARLEKMGFSKDNPVIGGKRKK